MKVKRYFHHAADSSRENSLTLHDSIINPGSFDSAIGRFATDRLRSG